MLWALTRWGAINNLIILLLPHPPTHPPTHTHTHTLTTTQTHSYLYIMDFFLICIFYSTPVTRASDVSSIGFPFNCHRQYNSWHVRDCVCSLLASCVRAILCVRVCTRACARSCCVHVLYQNVCQFVYAVCLFGWLVVPSITIDWLFARCMF